MAVEKTQSEQEATTLAGKILNYWWSRGFHKVGVWIERVEMNNRNDQGKAFYQIRSNLLNGWPRR